MVEFAGFLLVFYVIRIILCLMAEDYPILDAAVVIFLMLFLDII